MAENQNESNNNNNVIDVSIKNAYGRKFIYPINDLGVKMTELTGTDTFTDRHIEALKDLGYEVRVAPQEPVKL